MNTAPRREPQSSQAVHLCGYHHPDEDALRRGIHADDRCQDR
ncbi:hypothetical protein ACFPRL_24300 [Pseudoclavibacter helvolus]